MRHTQKTAKIIKTKNISCDFCAFLWPHGRMTKPTPGFDDVEIKVTISERKEQAAAKAFGLDHMPGQQRHIFFFDTLKLDLFSKGVVLRARKVKDGEDDSTVKIRPVDPKAIDARWRRMSGFKVEADGVDDRLVPAASLTVVQDRQEIEAVFQGERAIKKLLSSDQETFLSAVSRLTPDFGMLAVLGPVDAKRWKVQHEGLPFPITAEEWRLPSGKDLLEVSIKVPAAQSAAAAAAFTAFLAKQELKPEGGQETKTRVVLEFFARTLKSI
jgi:hypothetical protein